MHGIHVMDPATGAAVRFQLDGLISSLTKYDQAAIEADDTPVTSLLARLYEARRAAQEIEDRDAPLRPVPARRGVRLWPRIDK